MKTLHWAANAKDALLVARILTRHGITADLMFAHCQREFLEQLHCGEGFDLILIDASAAVQTKAYTMHSRARFPEASIILYGNELEAQPGGPINGPAAEMFLAKDELWLLPFVIRHSGSRENHR